MTTTRVLLIAGAAALFAAAPASAAKQTTIHLVEHADTDATTDTGAPGDSAGDVLTFANPVFNAANTKQVASDQGFCVRVVVGKSYECTWTNILKGGHIVVQGPFYDSKDSTLAITGGTGKYVDARGTMKLHARAGGTSYDFVFSLRALGRGEALLLRPLQQEEHDRDDEQRGDDAPFQAAAVLVGIPIEDRFDPVAPDQREQEEEGAHVKQHALDHVPPLGVHL